MTRLLCLLPMLLIACAAAEARTPDGRLKVLLAPNNAAPVIVVPGGKAEVLATKQVALALVTGNTTIPLAPSWQTDLGGRVRGTCAIPQDVPPGTYALRAGDTTTAVDENTRAVFVVASQPDTYTVAHIGDMAVPSRDGLRAALKAAEAGKAAIVFLTGNVTTSGAAADMQDFFEALDTCSLPTYVVPGENDAPLIVTYFRPMPYAARLGPDGFLVFDMAGAVPAPDVGPQPGDTESLRRDIRACRWSVGVACRYSLVMGLRTQLTLFVDAPLDSLLVAEGHMGPGAPKAALGRVPWGRTVLLAASPVGVGAVQLMDMTPTAMAPKP